MSKGDALGMIAKIKKEPIALIGILLSLIVLAIQLYTQYFWTRGNFVFYTPFNKTSHSSLGEVLTKRDGNSHYNWDGFKELGIKIANDSNRLLIVDSCTAKLNVRVLEQYANGFGRTEMALFVKPDFDSVLNIPLHWEEADSSSVENDKADSISNGTLHITCTLNVNNIWHHLDIIPKTTIVGNENRNNVRFFFNKNYGYFKFVGINELLEVANNKTNNRD